MAKIKEKGPPPPLPSDWDRCHAFLTKKDRYCRQERGKGMLYCVSHFYFITTCTPCPPTSTNDVTANDESEKRKNYIKRIRCPLDGSHTIYEAHLKSHLKKCNTAKNKIIDRSQAYYRHGVNQGGCGSLHQINVNNEKGGDDRNNNVIKSETKQQDETYYHDLAICILKAYILAFAPNSQENHEEQTRDDIINMTHETLYQYIKSDNHYETEKSLGFEDSLAEHRIKIGGPKHLEQIGSIVGHVKDIVEPSSSEQKIILEMGAGRATTGFVVGSVLAAAAASKHNCNDDNKEKETKDKDIKLILVEKAGSRGNADRAFRRKQHSQDQQGDNEDQQEKSSSYMNVNRVEVERIKCDLAHAYIPTILSMGNTTKDPQNDSMKKDLSSDNTQHRNVIVIAKHCCGVGTDLALKSLLPVKDRIHGCIFATCCHGICSWDDYVGRDTLYDIMAKANSSFSDRCFKFGKEEFDLMKRWACGTVIGPAPTQKVNERSEHGDPDELQQQEHAVAKNDQLKSITFVVKSMKLQCGMEGLGRACQRLIDFGRCKFMENHLFQTDGKKTTRNEAMLCHYVDSSVTPQNALLKGHI